MSELKPNIIISSFFEPFLSKGYKKRWDIYYYDFELDKRRKKSTKTTIQSKAFRELEKFKLTYLNNKPQIDIKTISELRDLILKYYQNTHSRKTLELYRIAFNSFIAVTSNKPLKLVTFADFESFKLLKAKTLANNSINVYLRQLRAGFNYAKQLGLIDINPSGSVKNFNIPEKQRLCFSDKELNDLLRVIGNHWIRKIVLFAACSGFRIGEILNLTWEDIDFENGIIRVSNKNDFLTKSGKEREIPLIDKLSKLIFKGEIEKDNNVLELNNPKEYIFSKETGEKYSVSHISKTFKKFIRAAQLDKKFHLHCLRHTALTNLARCNVSPYIIKQIAGHSDLKTTLIYVHNDMDEMRTAMERVNVMNGFDFL